MYVNIHTYIQKYTHTHTHTYIYIYTYTYIYSCIHDLDYLYRSICMCKYLFEYTHICTCIRTHTYMQLHIYSCIHDLDTYSIRCVCARVCACVYIYIYANAQSFLSRRPPPSFFPSRHFSISLSPPTHSFLMCADRSCDVSFHTHTCPHPHTHARTHPHTYKHARTLHCHGSFAKLSRRLRLNC